MVLYTSSYTVDLVLSEASDICQSVLSFKKMVVVSGSDTHCNKTTYSQLFLWFDSRAQNV